MPSNMVLRFRDLIDETIPEHLKYIKKFGYVWWGWWNKPEERVPSTELAYFQDIITDKGHMWIYLADSGTLRLYNAKLIGIDYNEDEDRKECKEIDKVPEYYFMSKYKVWFCLNDIIDANPNEIMEWAYDDPANFIVGNDSDKYQGNRVSNINEMLTSRHRTIYFIEKYNQVHKNNSKGAHKKGKNNPEERQLKINGLVDEILELIEDINRTCEYSPKKVYPPIQIPPYPKKMEKGLKCPAQDESSFREFSSHLYMLIIDGHRQVMKEDRAIISKGDFLTLASALFKSVRLFRCDLHHLDISHTDKRELGKLYYEVCGKNVLDDSNDRLKFQMKLLERTVDVLKNEYELVKVKITQFSRIRAVG